MIGPTSTFLDGSFSVETYDTIPSDAYGNPTGHIYSSPTAQAIGFSSPFNGNGAYGGIVGSGGGASLDHYTAVMRQQMADQERLSKSPPNAAHWNTASIYRQPEVQPPTGPFVSPDGGRFSNTIGTVYQQTSPQHQQPPVQAHNYNQYSPIPIPGGFADAVPPPQQPPPIQPPPLFYQHDGTSSLLTNNPTSLINTTPVPPTNPDGSRKILGPPRSQRNAASSRRSDGSHSQAGSVISNRSAPAGHPLSAPQRQGTYSMTSLVTGLPNSSPTFNQYNTPGVNAPSSPTKPTVQSAGPLQTTFALGGAGGAGSSGQVSTSRPPKRPRPTPAHRASQSLSVPKPSQHARPSYSDDESDSEPEVSAPRQTGKNAGKSGAGKQAGTEGLKRLPGACNNCKRLKMKCVFENDWDMVCRRCRDTGRESECHCDGRKPRQPSNKREQLMNLLKEKDKIIDALLRQIHNPSNQTPITFATDKLAPNLQPGGTGTADGAGASGSVAGTAKSYPNASTSSYKDIEAWLASSSANYTAYRSPYGKTFLDDDDSSDEEEREREREKSLEFSDSAFDSVSQQGRHNTDRLEVASAASSYSKPKKNHNRRLSNTDPKLHSIPNETAPLGFIAGISLESQTEKERELEREKQRRRLSSISHSSFGSNRSADKNGPKSADPNGRIESSDIEPPTPDGGPDDDVGPANKNYWKPGPSANPDLRRIIIERQMPPEILTSGLITPEEVEKLFKIFYEKLNVFVSILDPKIHTPATIYGRCPFLFTVICAISSRYYTEKPQLYNIAMHFAKVAASTSLINGWKSVELCQAYILLSVYPVHARRWEEDRTWLYLGLAIRMATDLNLHQPSTATKFVSEAHEREILNRTRTWLICYNLDRSCSTQFGKPTTIKDDSITRNSSLWYKKSQYNLPFDIHLCAYTQLLRIVQRFMEEVHSDPNSSTGLNKNIDFDSVTAKYNEELMSFKEETAIRFKAESNPNDPGCAYRVKLLPFLVHYSRLVMFSFGFQNSIQRGTLTRGNMFLVHCLDSASSVLKIAIEDLAPTSYFRYAADGHFVFSVFASAFLFKLLLPQFSSLLDPDQQNRILSLINRLIKTLASNDVAVDDRHTPKLYSRFLEGLLMRKSQMEKEEAENNAQQDGSGPANPSKASAPPITVTIPVPKMNPPPAQEPPHERIMSPTIEVHAPDESGFSGPSLTIDPNQPSQTDYLGIHGNEMFDGYAHSTTASSTIDAPPTHYSNEDVLMQGDDGWIAAMSALDSSTFMSHGLMPGWSWPWPSGVNTGSDAGSGIMMNDPVPQPQYSHDQMYYSGMNGGVLH